MSSHGVLMIDLLPFVHSTRPRKIASVVASAGPVTYVSLAAAGRSGMRTEVGATRIDGVETVAVSVPSLSASRTLSASIRNVCCYAIGLLRIFRAARKVNASMVVCSSPALLPMAAHLAKRGHASLVFDGRERPASVATRGSLAAWVAKVEPAIFRKYSKRAFGVVCAAPTHATAYSQLGFKRAHVMYNVPDFRATSFSRPRFGGRSSVLRVGMVGSLYPGRGAIELILGVEEARRRGVDVGLQIAGFGAPRYVEEMEAAARKLSEQGCFNFLGPLAYEQVRGFYESQDLGAVLYSATDRAQDSLSNKLFECLASGRGVISCDLPETSALVATLGIGLSVPVAPSAIADALEEVWAKPELVSRFAESAVHASVREFNWPRQAEALADYLAPAFSPGE